MQKPSWFGMLIPTILFFPSVLQEGGSKPEPRDPTEVDSRFRKPQPGLLPGDVDVNAAPQITLKGIVIAKGKKGAAILEINQQLYRVENGSQITVSRSGARSQTIRITVLNKEELRVELVSLGQTVILR